ncbi:MAG: 6-phosphofructokinase [Clostridiales bacterium]|nr:6-phosphofructokinase [Candidatus Crickella caballi]
MKKIAVLTSGGDAPGMNAAIRAVVRKAIAAGMEIYGVRRGYEGLIDDDIVQMTSRDVGGILYRGGTVLRTARSERFMDPAWVDVAAENLRKREIEAIVVIGGDGTYRGGRELSQRGITVAGVPATIDNDLGYTDYTIGFDTAVNTVVELINKIRDTSDSHKRTTIMEVMGRSCGDIALYSGVASGADIILLPEIDMDIAKLVDRVRTGRELGKSHILIVKAEGVDMPTGELREMLESLTGQETKAVIPGYIQRGGDPTAHDRLVADVTGGMAIDLLENPDKRPADSFAVGVRGTKAFAVSLEQAITEKAEFRQDLYELAEVLS